MPYILNRVEIHCQPLQSLSVSTKYAALFTIEPSCFLYHLLLRVLCRQVEKNIIKSMWNTFSVCLFRSAESGTEAISLALHSTRISIKLKREFYLYSCDAVSRYIDSPMSVDEIVRCRRTSVLPTVSITFSSWLVPTALLYGMLNLTTIKLVWVSACRICAVSKYSVSNYCAVSKYGVSGVSECQNYAVSNFVVSNLRGVDFCRVDFVWCRVIACGACAVYNLGVSI